MEVKHDSIQPRPMMSRANSSLPMKKRKTALGTLQCTSDSPSVVSLEHTPILPSPGTSCDRRVNGEGMPKRKQTGMSRSRELRLAQNRKAARESRKRKKLMIEELQKSTIFFSAANQKLKQENDELTRMLLDAQSRLANMGESVDVPKEKEIEVYGTIETPNNAATMTKTSPTTIPTSENIDATALPGMNPGSTMQEMANFQEAMRALMEGARKP